MKYIVVTGGVISGLGKGITISSIGRILKSSNIRVTSIKIDPYLNKDAGLMSPFEHGETFVLDDGAETDLDLGNYERFLDINLTGNHNITSGKAYLEVIEKERKGEFLGKTVQIVPHVTDTIQTWIESVSKIPVDGSGLGPQVCLIEVGGTVGDIESLVFLEALRQFQFRVGRENTMFIHVSLVPCVGSGSEQKTKPTQHSVKELRSLGLFPDMIVCRSAHMLSGPTKSKLSSFCQVDVTQVLSVHDVSNIYHVPLILVEQNCHFIIKQTLGLSDMLDQPDLTAWEMIAHTVDNFREKVKIAMVGKYNGQSDSYLSVIKSLMHSGIHLNIEVVIEWIDATLLEDEAEAVDPEKHKGAWKSLRAAAGVVIPGGFGVRGVEGKILAANFCRTNSVPMLGVCLGMQVMVIEFARYVFGMKNANSAEFDTETPNPVVISMPEKNPGIMGGTMRLGSHPTFVSLRSAEGQATIASQVYGLSESVFKINERHRHRYEVNPKMVKSLENQGLLFSGRDETGDRMEIAELPQSVHPYYIGAQFHPEFKSRPNRPSPLFYGLVAVSCGRKNDIANVSSLWHGISNLPATSTGGQHFSVESNSLAVAASSPTPYRKRSLSQLSPTSTVYASQKKVSEIHVLDIPSTVCIDSSRSPTAQPGKCVALSPIPIGSVNYEPRN